ncbi:MAG: NAD(P)H-hydrate dehydratase [Desulfovibrionales bacterium]|nr:NAD(P)H-hydrate dehydratase [Desulfovibrionales bacterium]
MSYIPLPTPAEMNNWDSQAINTYGIREEILMENASREALHVLLELVGSVAKKQILVFMGSGNNGGDAAALARHLHNMQANVLLLHTKPVRAYSSTTGYHFRLARTIGTPHRYITPANQQQILRAIQPDIIVDGLLGTGMRGTLSEDKAALIQQINKMGEKAVVFSIDIPSGMNGLLGTVSPVAVRADATVTFEAAKVGLMMPEASLWTGDVHVRSIGIPSQVQQDYAPSHVGLTRSILSHRAEVQPAMHKGTAGRVLIIGGSEGLTGAPQLAALGAMRSGAGYATVATPATLTHEIKQGHPEIITLPVGNSNEWPDNMPEALLSAIAQADSLVVGPGMGRSAAATAFLRSLLGIQRPPSIFDADALYHLSQDKNLLQSLSEEDVITPHPGEMAALCNTEVQTIQADRLAYSQHLATDFAGVTVLKGACSCIAQRETQVAISPFSTPTLAVAGSGDVLAGVIGAHLAQGLPARLSACLGVYEHGLAGAYLENEFPFRGNLPQEIAEALPKALQECEVC